jgi:dipeptidyl aminopeptidase/acylaminoacyl peptidase
MKVLSFAAACLALASTAFAAHGLRIEDVQTLSRPGNVRVSPDSRWVAFTVTRSDVEHNRAVTNLWVVAAAGGAPRQLTFGDRGANTLPRWSPDSQYLYFLSNRAGDKSQIFRLALAGGEAKQVTSLPVGVKAFVVSPDGKWLALTSSVVPACADMACNEKAAKDLNENPVKVRVITDVPFRRWDTWADGKRNHILLVPAEGGEAKDLTPGDVDSPVFTGAEDDEIAFSPDSKEICFSRYTENEALTFNSDLFVVPVAGGTPRAITRSRGFDAGPKYSPDGRYIAYGGSVRAMAESDHTRVFLYDRKAEQSTNVFEAVDRSVDTYDWMPDSASLVVTFGDRGQIPVARLDVATRKLTTLFATGTSADVDVARDGKFLAFSNMGFSRPKELFRLALDGSSNTPAALTRLNEEALRDITFGEWSTFSYPGWHGETVQAWQLKPPGFDPNRQYPLLLVMHGGPHSSWDNTFHPRWNAQLFAAAGYIVIMPNFHGSIGFGLKFFDSIKGQWGGAPYEDQMKAVDVALTWPYVDTTRIAAAGASYGGYMANWMEGHTDRFRAIVSHDGLYDLSTMMYSTDYVVDAAELGGTQWTNPQTFVDQAPSTYAKNFKTPMLIVHGGQDYRVDPSQGFAMFQVLQAMHVPSKLLFFPEENHWILKPGDSILWYHTVLDWLDQWVKPERAEYERRLRGSRKED